MRAIIQYLYSNKVLNLLIICVYYLAVVLPHEWIGKLIERTLDRPLGREQYNLIIASISVIVLGCIIYWIYKQVAKLSRVEIKLLVSLFILCIFLILLALKTIVVINIELIHVLQYGILAFMIFPFVRNFREALFWAVCMGALDELYQYLVLAPDKNDYFDFNDVILNLLGAALGLILIRISGVQGSRDYTFLRSPATRVMIFSCILIVLGFTFSWISIGPPDPDTTDAGFYFIKNYEEGFWHVLKKADPFHIVRPVEGLVIISVLFNTFKTIGMKFGQKSADS